MDKNIVCPWRVKETKTINKYTGGVDVKIETHREFEMCYGQNCPFYEINNPDAGYPNKCERIGITT